MRNFLLGLLLGSLGTYWYLTRGESLQAAISDLWDRASAPPASSAPPTTARSRH